MKTLLAILFILLAVQSYGVYGRAQADRVMFSCEMEVGPLCYHWKQNVIGKLLGTDKAEAMEEDLEEMRDAWDEAFVERVEDATRTKSDLEKAIDDVHDRASGKLELVSEKLKGVLEALEE